MIATETGELIVYISDDSIEPPSDAFVIDAGRASSCHELVKMITPEIEERNIVLLNLLEPFYDTSIPTREAARVLGRVKSTLECLVENGAHIAVLCRRRLTDLGTRTHFMASLCASADRVIDGCALSGLHSQPLMVHFRKST